ncbi:MAG: hypothetical protein EOP35_12590 [Rubrivivax sp.]|nr:MAG: hypothetical protein EOP35_12590 [Rubrivivax sp.]
MNATSRFAAGLAIAAACFTAFAQDAAAPAASRPDAIATTPATAKAANDKAVKRSDVATVVRTGPTIADRARQAGDKVSNKVDDMTSSDGTTVATNDGARNSTRDVTRAPRADRN